MHVQDGSLGAEATRRSEELLHGAVVAGQLGRAFAEPGGLDELRRRDIRASTSIFCIPSEAAHQIAKRPSPW
jgi:hypothetical protein